MILSATVVAGSGIQADGGGGKPVKRPKRIERYAEWPSTIRWTAPNGGTLRPGDDLRIDWSFDLGSPELAGVDEWEAFASADGGKSYFLKITPDMTLATRQVLWRVPDLKIDDFRVFLHVGGHGFNRFERVFELPRRFSIQGDLPPAHHLAPQVLHQAVAIPYRPVFAHDKLASALLIESASSGRTRFGAAPLPLPWAFLNAGQRLPSPALALAAGRELLSVARRAIGDLNPASHALSARRLFELLHRRNE